jgi:hypothetical protein
VYARVATFEGDPANADEAIGRVRNQIESGNRPPGLEGAKGMMMLVDRESGKGMGITFFDSEEDMQRGHEALNSMAPAGGGQRTSVQLYEVAIRFEG